MWFLEYVERQTNVSTFESSKDEIPGSNWFLKQIYIHEEVVYHGNENEW